MITLALFFNACGGGGGSNENRNNNANIEVIENDDNNQT